MDRIENMAEVLMVMKKCKDVVMHLVIATVFTGSINLDIPYTHIQRLRTCTCTYEGYVLILYSQTRYFAMENVT